MSYAFHLSSPAIVAAFALDIFFGDPKWLTHPVVIIGRAVSRGERLLRREDGKQNILWGAILVVFVTTFAGALAWLIVTAFSSIAWWLGAVAAILISSTTIAARGLDDAARTIQEALAAKDLAAARAAIPALAGRDPDSLDWQGIIRATIESLAENASDGIIAPLLYLFVAGPVGAIVYKAVNTLDSMIGYRDDRYIYFGRVAARLDDVANFAPARITAGCIAAAAMIVNGRARNAISTCFKEAAKHASPNAGWPEAAMAGALGVQLGGNAVYGGEIEARAFLGGGDRAPRIDDLRLARQIVRISAVFSLAIFAVCRYLVVSV